MKLYLIRHGMTEGNKKKRYIGITDESLCEEGRGMLIPSFFKEKDVECVIVSPLKRCLETAKILFPGVEMVVIEKLSECDFGSFENKNYQELSGDARYQAWIDSNGTLPFPGGESVEDFKKRTKEGFLEALSLLEKRKIESAAMVVHGGTIMTIMEAFAYPKAGYYDYMVKNGEGYELDLSVLADGVDRICSGSSSGGSQVAVSSGPCHRTSDRSLGKNYKKMPS